MTISACSKPETIVGTWEGEVSVSILGLENEEGEKIESEQPTTVYFVFNDDGTGMYGIITPEILSSYESNPLSFTYEIQDNVLLLLFKERSTERYEYVLKGDSLFLSGSMGRQYQLSRKINKT